MEISRWCQPPDHGFSSATAPDRTAEFRRHFQRPYRAHSVRDGDPVVPASLHHDLISIVPPGHKQEAYPEKQIQSAWRGLAHFTKCRSRWEDSKFQVQSSKFSPAQRPGNFRGRSEFQTRLRRAELRTWNLELGMRLQFYVKFSSARPSSASPPRHRSTRPCSHPRRAAFRKVLRPSARRTSSSSRASRARPSWRGSN